MAGLKRTLGFWPIFCLAITSIMGTTLYFGPSVGAAYSGASSIVALILLTLIAVYISFFFGELVSMYPKAGGVYEFSKHAYNRFASFIIGWIAWLLGNLMTALLIVAAINYLIPNPEYNLLKIAISIGLILLLNIIAFLGVELSAYFQIVFAGVSIGIISALIFPGIFKMDIGNLSPIFSASLPSILVTMFLFAEGFFGWESATYLSEETKNPKKIIPKALVSGTIVVGLMTIMVAIISFGLLPLRNLINSPAPLVDASSKIFGASAVYIFGIGVFLSLIGSAASGIITMPRLILALARDKLFLSPFKHIHKKYNTPHNAIWFQTIISLIFFGMAFGRYKTLLTLVVPLGFVMYFLIILSVLILRYKKPNIKREFVVPFGEGGAIFTLLCLFVLMVSWIKLEPNAINILKLELSFILIGIPIYLLLMFYNNPSAVARTSDLLAWFNLLAEKIMMPKRIQKILLSMLGDLKNKRVFEYGCSIGTMTLPLTKSLAPSGKIYATDFSRRNILITRKRLLKEGSKNAVIIRDEQQIRRVHHSVPKVDAIVSVDTLGGIQDVTKVLRDMNKILHRNGKIVFMDHVDIFKFIPNTPRLADERTVKRLFKESGFNVFVVKKKGLLWNYLFVCGTKE